MSDIDYSQAIPNNVDLASDRRLQRALEQWQPDYLAWWSQMGPAGFDTRDVWLRTATSAEPRGWNQFGYVRMPEYRWGIFLAPREADRVIPMGDHAGKPAWQEVPGEYRNLLKRIIVTQADTEPASVEQQRQLAATAPSLYDMRNLFQVNVEEGRHLWQMVYLLHAWFGRDGREEAEELLARRSGDADKPRMLDAFNQPCDDWLSFFCFTMFTDRDGKYQLAALAESGFDPLSRSCRFMLTEEAHHLFVGETGLDRIVRRSAQLAKQSPHGLASELGGIDLHVMQKYLNYWFSFCLDLFGGEVSTNAAEAFAAGIKGRFHEARRADDHRLLDAWYRMSVVRDDRLVDEDVPMRNALNEVLRGDYRDDCQRAMDRWNKTLADEGVEFRLTLPSLRFNRRQGLYAGHRFTPEGELLTEAGWAERHEAWLPTEADREAVRRVQVPVTAPGAFAQWIAPPAKGVGGKSLAFEYVRA